MQRTKRYLSSPFTNLNKEVKFNDFIFSVQDINELFAKTDSLQKQINTPSVKSFGNIWHVYSGQTITIEHNIENVVSKMDVDGNLIIEGKLTTGI